MPFLRGQLEREDETPQLLELALLDRYAAGIQAFTAGNWDTTIYLLGYVAEMTLKTAYFRLVNAALTDTIDTLLPPARVRGQTLLPNLAQESFHSLLFWAEMIRETRRQGRTLPVHVDLPFTNCYRRLYHNWWVEMRYHPNHATADEAREVSEDVAWLLAHRAELWR